MSKEQICYYCRKWQRLGVFGLDNRCSDTGEKKESFDSCNGFDGVDND